MAAEQVMGWMVALISLVAGSHNGEQASDVRARWRAERMRLLAIYWRKQYEQMRRGNPRISRNFKL